MGRRKYSVRLWVNGHRIEMAMIDSHYELNHSASMNDEIILELLSLLSGQHFIPDDSHQDFDYYVTDNLILKNKKYRLIWLIEKKELYIGVINAFRR